MATHSDAYCMIEMAQIWHNMGYDITSTSAPSPVTTGVHMHWGGAVGVNSANKVDVGVSYGTQSPIIGKLAHWGRVSCSETAFFVR